MQQLLDQGAEVSAKDKKGLTGLHFAAARNRAAVARFLWSKAADVDSESLGESIHSRIYG